MIPTWQPEIALTTLSEYLNNSFRRITGLPTHRMSTNFNGFSTLKSAMSTTLGSPLDPEPIFMHLTPDISEACSLKAKKTTHLKRLATEILEEFYSSAHIAFQECQLRLRESADTYLQDIVKISDENHREVTLNAADEIFAFPSWEEMETASLPYTHQFMTPFKITWMASWLGMSAIMFLLRHPLLTFVCGPIIAIVVYSCNRNLISGKATAMLEKLPQDLYHILRQKLIDNHHHYCDAINNSTSKAATEDTQAPRY